LQNSGDYVIKIIKYAWKYNMADHKYKRWQYDTVNKSLQSRRVIVLSGSRQCGKTTLSRDLASIDAIYRSLDDVTLLEAALSDPHGFVRHGNELMIIDEVQKAPTLLQAVKMDVDQVQKPGRFLLTGSANLYSIPAAKESLAGRISNIRLRPLTQGELYGKQPCFLENAFNKVFKTHEIICDKDAYIITALKGGFPEALSLGIIQEESMWYKDYIAAITQRDLHDIINIKRQNSMKELLYVLAAWSSKFIDISAICSSLGIARQTLVSYINALEALYLVERVRPWSKTDYDRVNKHDKLFMTDTGIMGTILGWRFEKIRLDGDKTGKLIETFVFTQLAALIDAQQQEYQIYHYRDREKREVDFIIENEDGNLLGIEVKAGSALSQDSFKHLKWFRDNMAGKHTFIGIVLYTGENVLSFGSDMWAVPISVLWG
jgi:predicted AAA+ superfamily ATPase